MLFEGTTFTDIPHRKEWKDLAKKWAKWQSRRCGRYTALPVKRMPNTGGTAELYSCCSSCKFRKQSLGCKAMLHMHVNYFFFSSFDVVPYNKEFGGSLVFISW